MKKTVFRLLAGAMAVLMLTGCGGAQTAPEAEPTGQPVQDIELTETRAQLPNVSVYADALQETTDQTVLYEAMGEYFRVMDELRAGARELAPDLSAFTAAFAQPIFSGKQENTVYSPASLYLALSMLADSTGGETKAQIVELLGREDYAQAANAMWRMIYENGGILCQPANSLWGSAACPLKPELGQTLAENYYADSFTVPMGSPEADQTMQIWLNEHTGGQLTEQAQSVQSDPSTVLGLMSTLYFHALWQLEFSEEETFPADFTLADGARITADFLHSESDGSWHQGQGFVSSDLYFTDGSSMRLILPDEGILPEQLLTDPATVQDMLTASMERYTYINWALPKFDVSADVDLREPMQSLGILDAFDPQVSDFTPATEQTAVSLSSAQQASRVSIDEHGCTAATFTLLMGVGSGIPEEYTLEMNLNRPFIFAIMSSNDTPLFLGTVYTP